MKIKELVGKLSEYYEDLDIEFYCLNNVSACGIVHIDSIELAASRLGEPNEHRVEISLT